MPSGKYRDMARRSNLEADVVMEKEILELQKDALTLYRVASQYEDELPEEHVESLYATSNILAEEASKILNERNSEEENPWKSFLEGEM